MQVANVKGFEKRAQYYAARAYCNQIDEGESYEEFKRSDFFGHH
jgi:hypothetical protein